jgi:hypothetical protein
MIKGRIDVDVEEQRKGCKEDMELSVVANHDRRYSGESAGREATGNESLAIASEQSIAM